MDDPGNLANETMGAMSDATGSGSSELRKRRSARIVQAVPLQVTGVDALGRPFVERTSSLIVNSHGCRYQSKHYVLKNMWVRVEVPNPTANQAPRMIRGRVAWIQRPRTVRQLFQVALELEVPGNVWGIAFPPEDWVPYNEPEKAQAAAAGTGAALGTSYVIPTPPPPVASPMPPPVAGTEFHVTLNETDLPAASGTDNLRVFPFPASPTDASLQLARQVTRLLGEARQQIQAAAREAAVQAVSAERRVSADQWEQTMTAAREEFSRQLAGAIEKIQEESTTRSRAAQEASVEAMQIDFEKKLAPQLEEVTRHLAVKLSDESKAQRTEHTLQLTSAVEVLRTTCQQAEETISRLRERTEQSEADVTARVEAARRSVEEAAREQEAFLGRQRESLNSAANEIQQQVASALASAHSTWRTQLTDETQAAQARWTTSVDSTLAAAQERATVSLNEHANTLLSQFQEEAERRSGSLQEAAARAMSQFEQQLASVRESLQAEAQRIEAGVLRANEASGKLDNFAARLETAEQQALTVFQSQLDDVLSLHRNELHRRSESMFEEIVPRIRSTFEESTRQALSQFGSHVDEIVRPQISKVDESMLRLAGGRSLMDAATALNEDKIRSAADEACSEALGQFRQSLGDVEQSFRGSAESLAARNLSELEVKAEGVKHQTVEDLIKSAEWYEKKAQTQIQTVADKTSERSAAQLREKASLITSEFASELDQSSRNFVSYAQTQMAEVVSEGFERTRALFTEAAETTSAAFIDEIQRQARQDLDGFDAALQTSAAAARAQMEDARVELAQKVTTEQEDFLRRFQNAMNEAVEAGVVDANLKVQAGFEPLLKSWKSMSDTQQAEMHGVYARLGEQAAEQYRERLDNVSNQWMLATVTSLDHQWREVVAGIAATAEQRLRETCTKVFADLGDALRERLQQMGSTVTAPGPRLDN